MIIGKALFINGELDQYLRGQESGVENHVREKFMNAMLGKSDAEIAQELLVDARMEPLAVDFGNPQKDARDARVTVHDTFSGPVKIDGVRATRAFPFTGDSRLFDLKPSSWSSVLPRGEVQGKTIVIGMEGRNDPETLKREIDRQEEVLREYVGNSTKQVEQHNQKLEGLLLAAIARRRQHLTSIDDLKGRI